MIFRKNFHDNSWIIINYHVVNHMIKHEIVSIEPRDSETESFPFFKNHEIEGGGEKGGGLRVIPSHGYGNDFSSSKR